MFNMKMLGQKPNLSLNGEHVRLSKAGIDEVTIFSEAIRKADL